MSSVWGVRWGYHIGGFTPGGGSGAYSVVSTLVYAVGVFCSFGTKFRCGRSCVVAAMLKIETICFRSAVFLLPSVVSGMLSCGFMNACMRTEDACVSASSEDIFVNGRVAEKKYVMLETHSLSVLGI